MRRGRPGSRTGRTARKIRLKIRKEKIFKEKQDEVRLRLFYKVCSEF